VEKKDYPPYSIGIWQAPWSMGQNYFLDTLVSWKITQLHALAAGQPLAPVLGLSQSSPASLWNNYSLVQTPKGASDQFMIIYSKSDANKILDFSIWTLIKQDMPLPRIGTPRGSLSPALSQGSDIFFRS
jgi:hypothetical protein